MRRQYSKAPPWTLGGFVKTVIHGCFGPMNGGMKTRLALVGFILFLFQAGSVLGAELRYIRIGEHKTHTRIVFELRGSANFKEPVVKGKGRFSVVFVGTTTSLPKQILSETTKRVDAIEFVQDKSQLAANVILPFPYFKIKSFALSNPQRVVLDIRQSSSPPEGVVFEETIGKEQPAKPLAEVGGQKAVSKPKTPPIQEAKQDVTKPPEVLKKPEAMNTPAPLVKPSPEIAQTAPPKPPTAEKASPVAVPKDESPPSVLGFGNMQTYLLVALLVLSVVIVGLLAFMVGGKRRGPALPRARGRSAGKTDFAQTVAAIDARIKNEFKKIDQS